MGEVWDEERWRVGGGVGWKEIEVWGRCGIERDGGIGETWNGERWRDGGGVGWREVGMGEVWD